MEDSDDNAGNKSTHTEEVDETPEKDTEEVTTQVSDDEAAQEVIHTQDTGITYVTDDSPTNVSKSVRGLSSVEQEKGIYETQEETLQVYQETVKPKEQEKADDATGKTDKGEEELKRSEHKTVRVHAKKKVSSKDVLPDKVQKDYCVVPPTKLTKWLTGAAVHSIKWLVEEETKLPRNLVPLPDLDFYKDGSCAESRLMTFHLGVEKKRLVQEALREKAERIREGILRRIPCVEDSHEEIKSDEHALDVLRKRVETVVPPTLLQTWVQSISDKLNPKFMNPVTVNDLFLEVRDEFDECMHDLTIRSLLWQGEDTTPRKEWSLGLGRTTRYHLFLKRRELLRDSLFITHPVIRGILKLSNSIFPNILHDFNIYTELGTTELQKLRISVFNDLKKDESFIKQIWLPKIAALFDGKKRPLACIPLKRLAQFFDCASNVVQIQLTELMRRSMDHFVKAFGDPTSIPVLKLDIYYDGGLQLLPSVKDIIEFTKKVVENISNIGREFPTLESLANVRAKSEFLSVKICESYYEDILQILTKKITLIYEPVMNHLRELHKKYGVLYSDDLLIEINAYLGSDCPFEEICDKINYFKEYILSISDMVSHEYFPVAKVSQVEIIRYIKECASGYIDLIINRLIEDHKTENMNICGEFEEIERRALKVPESTAELMGMGEYMAQAATIKMEELTQRITRQLYIATQLMGMTSLAEDHIRLNTTTVNWLHVIKNVFDLNSSLYEKYKVEFEEILKARIDELNHQLKETEPHLVMLNSMDNARKLPSYADIMRKFLKKFESFDKEIEWINAEEALLKFGRSTYPLLDDLKNIVEPFAELVFLSDRWKRTYAVWMDGTFEDLNGVEMEEQTDNFYKETLRIQKQYRQKIKQMIADNNPRRFTGNMDDPDTSNHPAPLKLTDQIIKQIKEFRSNVRLVTILCNPALTKMHWEELKSIFGQDITPDAGTTLRKMTKLGLEPFIEEFEIVSTGASRAMQLYDNLKKMHSEWDSIRFIVNQYRDTNIPVLGSIDDIQSVLDDHIVKILSMRGSAFVKPHINAVQQFYDLLTRVNSTLEQWGKVQGGWMYLTPIFSSKDICAQMPEESQMFQELDQTYKRKMALVQRDSRVLEAAGAPGVLETLKECVENLEKINDGVNNYLERKRLYFARFFFLSNDEMLEILSETKDPLRVQPHVKKCFEGINRLGFDDDLNIHSFVSCEGETIRIVSEISTPDARGSVEKWLVQLEAQMIITVRDVIFKAWKAYSLYAREHWVTMWPGQIVICVSQIYWTAEVHNCIRSSQIRDLSEYHSDLVDQLNQVVNLVRGKLSRLTRITLSALIVIDVHAKDVVLDLAEKNVSSESDFYWLAQLRYYWEDDCMVRLINATIPYAYEYLGNTPRLVITPLTDRCYRTLVGAFQLHLNGAPEGPAGTGKTETTKDLAKAIAVQCIVFNCSEGLDYIAMGKFFKGAASCGAWICFDEFNRIDLEVLSVIAQQILCIIVAVQAGLPTFVFEGTTLKLNPMCYICITMNPGYAGRSELPDNLKVLFRTVAMMVPDYAMIGEISLYSCGYVDARKLAVKIVSTYKLCSEQLSSQSHYDYGMRAVKTVLSAAGNLKVKFPDENEALLLLRSIIDVNLPKFLRHDVPLFEGIISDLFPSVTLPTPDYRQFIRSIVEVCEKRNYQPVEAFITKIIQTYEMMIVRHGFMLVGEPFAGKTLALHVLAEVMALLNEWGELFEPVDYVTINPKAITMGQLYGQFDPVSYEWSDGIVAMVFRDFSMSTDLRRKWIIFDGPVDAGWIENMNSSLDDNKKLCLTSGEVIAMTPLMSLIFEVMDLAQASPATVSRCGMIYFEPSSIGWRPLMLSWLKTCNPVWSGDHQELIKEVCEWMIDPCMEFIRKNCFRMVDAGVTNAVKGFLQLFEMVMNEATENEEDFKKNTILWFTATFIFCGVWGLGGTLDTPSQQKFDNFFKSMWRQEGGKSLPESLLPMDIAIPADGTFYDYVYTYKQKGFWKNWPEIAKTIKLEETINLSQMLVPTVESAKYAHLFEMHIKYNVPLLWMGPTGTGKSFCLQNMLMKQVDQEKYLSAFLTLTVQISANLTQELIFSKLVKRRRGIYGPPSHLKRCVLFVDDINLPVKEVYGAQPPLELLRQFFDHGHWYDLKDMTKIFLYDVLILSAMGPPGGSRQDVYARSLRHFKLYSINPLSDDSMVKIFTNVLLIAYRRNGFAQDVMQNIIPIVHATLDMYKAISNELRPTPAKSHYIFNLRDYDRVIKGCALFKKESAESRRSFITLWVHEVLRVFYDRLIGDDGKKWVFEYIKQCVSTYFKDSLDSCLETMKDESDTVNKELLEGLIFCNCMDQDALEADRKYELTRLEDFRDLAQSVLEEYNSSHKTKIDVVLFKFAVCHLARICRIIATPSGSGLLVGIGGSGRKSLSRLAASIMNSAFFFIEMSKAYGVSDWRDDMKTILKESGGKGKDTVFYFSETHVKEELFLQDIDSLLNSGEVPNIFAVDERQEILEMVRLAAQGGNRNIDISPLQVFAFFINRCKQKLHMMLCFSPVGSSFRSRLRLYPALVNCCTIIWYEMWPEDALAMVAEKYVGDITLPEEVRKTCVDACKYFHATAKVDADKFYVATGRKAYITSAAFLELIRSFAVLILKKQDEIKTAKMRYVGGLDKLDFAASQVGKMKEELVNLQPKLAAAVDESLRIVAIIEQESGKIERATALVREDEKLANAQADASQALKAECEADLALAIPILEEAIQALRTLKPQDVTLVKSMKNPPDTVKLVMQAVCIMRGVPPDRVDDKTTARKKDDYWGPSLKMMTDINFLQALRDYDKDNIPPDIMAKIRKEILPNKSFSPPIVAKASSAAEGICKWIIAMDMYDVVAKEVAPKKAKLEIAELEYAKTMEVLNKKRAEVQALEEQLDKLNEKLAEANNQKKALEDEVELCRNKLLRAEKLIGGLGGEQSRWTNEANRLQDDFDALAGDILLSCAVIAYLTTFTMSFRTDNISRWHSHITGLKIPCSKHYSFIKTLGSDIKIQGWNIFGLPRDTFSIENAIIVDNSRRYCLMIDPQGQANKWIKNMEKLNGLLITKFSDSDYMKVLELALSTGRPLLLENVLEDVESPINPVLNKSFFRQGNSTYISLGDNTVECSVNFRFYMTSKLRNPRYLPEVFNMVTLVNFALTADGLEDQLLAIVVAKERPDLEDKRQTLIIEDASNKKALNDVEENILKTLSQSKGNILEDECAIEILDSSKLLVNEIKKRQEAAKDTQEKINGFRRSYKPIAVHSASLFYCITDLPNIDPMYQYSLTWFINLYIASIEVANKAKELERRLYFLKDTFTINLYSNVSRSLFEKDKLVFSCLLCTTILIGKKVITRQEFLFFITGGVGLDNQESNPGKPWLNDKSWGEICRVGRLASFDGFKDSFVKNINEWKAFYDLAEPQDAPLPASWSDGRPITAFQKCIVIRMIRPDKVLTSVSAFVENSLDKRFVTPPPFDIAKSYTESNCLSPLIFILSPGADPMAALLKFAAKKNQTGHKFQSISLGQGQGPIAAAMIREAQVSGGWVCLQNCHVAVSWMNSLEKIWENLDPSNTALGFRLWLTSYPSPAFPVAILQYGVKMTNEPPTGLRMNLMRSYLSEPLKETDFFEGCPGKDRSFGKLLYSISFFHAVVLERRKFGPIGWNIPYSFNESDFQISVRQLQMFMNEYEHIPYKAIAYLTGECNYGGRVTDDWDRRTLTTILDNFINSKVVEDPNYVFCPGGTIYGLPRKGEYKVYLKHIEAIPPVPPPEVYGLHMNAGITRDLQSTKSLMDSMLAVQGKPSRGDGDGADKLLLAIIRDIISKIPKPFDTEAASEKFPVSYSESMNTVLVQEMDRFNKLLKVISSTLIELEKAVKGLVVMSASLEAVSDALLISKVPAQWAKASYPSLKPLSPYISDFCERMKTLQDWLDKGKPVVFWLSGFYFTQAFLTGALQDYARKYAVPIDTLSFDFQVLKEQTALARPADGVYCNRIYIQGARWDLSTSKLAEQIPKVLYDMLPIIWFKPAVKKDIVEGSRYKCPLYRTTERRGVLSTTGHSTNFVLPIFLPSDKPSSHWIMRGAALLSQLDD